MAIAVRKAQASDIDWITGQLKSFSDFYGSKIPLFGDEDYVRAQLAVIIDQHVVFVAEREDKTRVGFISGMLSVHPFNPKITVLSEVFWWVEEQSRGSRAGLLLLNAFVEFGREHADWVTCALEDASPLHPKCLEKRGFRLKERSYLMEVHS